MIPFRLLQPGIIPNIARNPLLLISFDFLKLSNLVIGNLRSLRQGHHLKLRAIIVIREVVYVHRFPVYRCKTALPPALTRSTPAMEK